MNIVATDVGGTFTDYVILQDGELRAFKALTTRDASEGILKHLGDEDIDEFSHGTTAAVNAVLERSGATVVFFTTAGFRDLVRIGRQARLNVYSFNGELPQVPVDQIVEVEERIGSNGTVLKSISKVELEKAAAGYSKGATVAVVGFINSYVNPQNELIAENVLSQYFSTVLLSHQVRREIREYDRFCTALMEGYSLPVVRDYIKHLKPLSEKFYIMQSNGGRANLESLRAVNMIMSGPAGGVAATQALCNRLGIANAIAYDMGGTSADVSIIVNGEPQYTDTAYITGIPIRTLAIEIESIGAGGGSIAWIDDGGALKVGPKSAGSNPGPACYNRGGKDFTVSDANLIMGVLGNKISEIPLDGVKSIEAAKTLCHTLGMDPLELSSGVRRIVNNNMVSALKRISIGKGHDPRKFTIAAFGGAGPMHACAIANSIDISRIIIPPQAGAFSARGIMSAPVRFDHIQTLLAPVESARDEIPRIIEGVERGLQKKLAGRFKNAILHLSLDMRYRGQGHEINVPQNVGDEFIDVRAFHTRHEALFGFSMPNCPVEVVNVKLVFELPAKRISLRKFQNRSPQKVGTRNVHPHGDICVYRKDFFGGSVKGPCIIEDDTTTVYVTDSWEAKLDGYGVLHLERD